MLTSTIVLIVLRLFSISWLVQGLSMLAGAAFGFSPLRGRDVGPEVFLAFLPALVMLLCATVMWFAASAIARMVAGKADAPVAVAGLTLTDLYAFAFVFLGLYFVLHSLADVLNWLHYAFLVAVAHDDFDPERKRSLYGLSRPLITMVAGLVCLFSGRKWARKLSALEKES
ncbi:MAG TPA: hypothetical protein VL527_14235 [Dongiaceae bacterium]|jgi:hypothetical protein|nr:hypothetical protein [Dongiaceae bacterium]